MDIVDLTLFEDKLDGGGIAHRHTYLDHMLSNFLLGHELFTDFSKIKWLKITVGRDHDKGVLVKIMTFCAQFRDNLKSSCLDEFFGVI